MGNGVSTDQGNLPSHGTRDVGESADTEQHDWSQLAEAPNTNTSLKSTEKPYSYTSINNFISTFTPAIDNSTICTNRLLFV